LHIHQQIGIITHRARLKARGTTFSYRRAPCWRRNAAALTSRLAVPSADGYMDATALRPFSTRLQRCSLHVSVRRRCGRSDRLHDVPLGKGSCEVGHKHQAGASLGRCMLIGRRNGRQFPGGPGHASVRGQRRQMGLCCDSRDRLARAGRLHDATCAHVRIEASMRTRSASMLHRPAALCSTMMLLIRALSASFLAGTLAASAPPPPATVVPVHCSFGRRSGSTCNVHRTKKQVQLRADTVSSSLTRRRVATYGRGDRGVELRCGEDVLDLPLVKNSVCVGVARTKLGPRLLDKVGDCHQCLLEKERFLSTCGGQKGDKIGWKREHLATTRGKVWAKSYHGCSWYS
jgi:predicted transglutaminase-like cysteine proteinase